MSDKESTNIETALENVVEDAIIIESDSTAQESLKKVKTGGLWPTREICSQ